MKCIYTFFIVIFLIAFTNNSSVTAAPRPGDFDDLDATMQRTRDALEDAGPIFEFVKQAQELAKRQLAMVERLNSGGLNAGDQYTGLAQNSVGAAFDIARAAQDLARRQQDIVRRPNTSTYNHHDYYDEIFE